MNNLQAAIDKVFGENGCLPAMPVEGNGVILLHDIYCVYDTSSFRGTPIVQGWIHAHKAYEGATVEMFPVSAWIDGEQKLCDLKFNFGAGSQLPNEWVEELRRGHDR